MGTSSKQTPHTAAAHPPPPAAPAAASPCCPATRRRVPPSNSVALSSSPFAPRTPLTPSTTSPACTADETAFQPVSIHTAKCTECDKRNTAVMRRCPGCTFQVCTACYARREQEGRGLRHGIAMSGPASPATARTVRTRVARSTLGSSGSGADRMAEWERTNRAGKTEQVKVQRKKQEKKKRAVRKKQTVTYSDDDDDDDDYDDDVASGASDLEESEAPTPSKHRRRAQTMDDSSPETQGTKRMAREPPESAGRPAKRTNVSSQAEETGGGQASSSLPSSSATDAETMARDINELMRAHGVNTADNPYHEHLLGRRQPAMFDSDIWMPDIVTRNFKPRPTAEEIERTMQEKVRKKLEEMRREAADDPQSRSVGGPVHDGRRGADARQAKTLRHGGYTVKVLVETEAAKCRDRIAMEDGEYEALTGVLESAALSWGSMTYSKLPLDKQVLMRPGLHVRLDLLDAAYEGEATLLLGVSATEKLRAMGKMHGELGA